MNSIHEQYLNRGETLYIGTADSITIRSGLNRIGFAWKINADPRITKAVIYWNERSDSTVIPVVRTAESEREMWMSAELRDMAEGEYIFEFEMQDNNGHVSKSIEIAGTVLGDLYVENLRNRGIKSIAKLLSGEMQIIWEPVSVTASSLLYSVIEYDSDGNTVKREVPNGVGETLLEGLQTGDAISIYTMHKPEEGLDEIPSHKRVFVMPKFEREIPKDRFQAAFKPGDNTTPHPGGGENDWTKPITDFGVGQRSLAKIWDGGAANNTNGKTILHTEDQSGNANARFKFPHHFTIDIGAQEGAVLSRMELFARVDNGSFSGHSPRFFEIWATDVPKERDDFATQAEFETYYRTTYVTQRDPAKYDANDDDYTDKQSNYDNRCHNFVAPAPAPGIYNWQEDWIKLGDFECEKPSAMNYNQRNDADNAVWSGGFNFTFPDDGKRVRYIRLVIKFPNWQNTNCVNLGEITLYGDDI
jgi:hypothetical protein